MQILGVIVTKCVTEYDEAIAKCVYENSLDFYNFYKKQNFTSRVAYFTLQTSLTYIKHKNWHYLIISPIDIQMYMQH